MKIQCTKVVLMLSVIVNGIAVAEQKTSSAADTAQALGVFENEERTADDSNHVDLLKAIEENDAPRYRTQLKPRLIAHSLSEHELPAGVAPYYMLIGACPEYGETLLQLGKNYFEQGSEIAISKNHVPVQVVQSRDAYEEQTAQLPAQAKRCQCFANHPPPAVDVRDFQRLNAGPATNARNQSDTLMKRYMERCEEE